MYGSLRFFFFFFFNDTATTEIYTLSLHDALPILTLQAFHHAQPLACVALAPVTTDGQNAVAVDLLADVLRGTADRKSTRLNSSHSQISYAVFCLKKKKISRG